MIHRDLCYLLAKQEGFDYDRVMQASVQETMFAMKSPELFVTCFEQQYPASLKELRKPPVLLCFKGDIKLLDKPMVAIIGARKCSSYGLWATQQIVAQLPSDIVIVSGMAKGIDGAAHMAAIQSGKKTIALLGSGLDYCYPEEHRTLFQELGTSHLLLSEYTHDIPVRKHHFPARNRLIAALADVVVVVESRIRSGTATTVKEALDLGREIYCIPHRLCDELGAGNHLLIQEGANIIYDIGEFCDEISSRNNLTNKKIPLR